MTAADDLSGVLQIDGVKGYYFTNYDGSDATTGGTRINDLVPLISYSGLNADIIRSSLDFSDKFNQIVISRKNREDLLIFPFNRSLLAVMKSPDASTRDLVQKVHLFIVAKKEELASQE